MDIRNVQRTGNMCYVYLPTAWCKKYDISSKSKVGFEINNDGSLSISPFIVKKQDKCINLDVLGYNNQDILIKLIMACYINPTKAFKIKLGNRVNLPQLFDQKKVISGLEFVEVDGHNITYESSMTINEPDSLLKTLIKKVRNLLSVMINNYNIELINKYEEEIDRSKTLIHKATTGALSFYEKCSLKPIDLHYIALISMDLEDMVDHIRFVDKEEKRFLRDVLNVVGKVKDILENLNMLDYKQVLELTRIILNVEDTKVKDIKTYDKKRIKQHLINVSEALLDWAVTKELERS